MTKTEKQVQQTKTRAPEAATAKRAFVKPVLERHERLPEITGFSF